MTPWIKVEDELPEEGQKVFYYCKKVGVHTGYYSHSSGYDCFGGSHGWLCDDVTHWMPLPNPPGDE